MLAGMSRGIWFGSLVAAVIVVGAPRRAEACSCVQPPPPKKALADSSAVFEGKIVEMVQDKEKHRLTVTFAVSRRWKGAETAQVEVTTVDVGSLCGLPFNKGEEWLVYADGEAGALSTGLCTRTRKKSEAGEDRRALGAGKPAAKETAPAKDDPLASGAPTGPATPEPTKGDPPGSGTPAGPATPTKSDPLASGTPAAPATPEPAKGDPLASGTKPAEPPAKAAPVSPPPAQSGGCGIAEPSWATMIVVPMLFAGRRRRNCHVRRTE